MGSVTVTKWQRMLNEFGICFVKCGNRHRDGPGSRGVAWNSHYSDDVACHMELVTLVPTYGNSRWPGEYTGQERKGAGTQKVDAAS